MIYISTWLEFSFDTIIPLMCMYTVLNRLGIEHLMYEQNGQAILVDTIHRKTPIPSVTY